MSLPLIITRPWPDCEASAARAAAMGIDVHAIPLFTVHPHDWDCPDPADFDALLLTSAQAPRLAGPALAALATLPCHAVGTATATAARDAGLDPLLTGTSGAQPLLDAMVAAGRRRILWLCGAEHMPLVAAAGTLMILPCYTVRVAPPNPAWTALIENSAVVAVYSVRAARHIAALAGSARKHLKLAAISRAVADAAGHGWRAVAVADEPGDAALLSKARLLCHNAEKRVVQE